MHDRLYRKVHRGEHDDAAQAELARVLAEAQQEAQHSLRQHAAEERAADQPDDAARAAAKRERQRRDKAKKKGRGQKDGGSEDEEVFPEGQGSSTKGPPHEDKEAEGKEKQEKQGKRR